MLNKNEFCLLIKAMKEDYNRDINIYDALSKYNIYINKEEDPLTTMVEKLIDCNFDPFEEEQIYSYCYPIGEEKENITPEELYDEIYKKREKKYLISEHDLEHLIESEFLFNDLVALGVKDWDKYNQVIFPSIEEIKNDLEKYEEV